MRKRKVAPVGIESILNKVIKKIEKKGPGKKENVLAAWRKVAGDKAVGHSRPANIKRRVLTIEIDSSTWFYMLNLKKQSLLKGLRKELGEETLKEIRFRMGDIT